MLSKTDFFVDTSVLLPLLDKVQWDHRNRSQLNTPTGHWLYDPYVICKEWKGTEFDKVLSSIPFPIGEARLMKLMPEDCYRAHADADDRLHLTLTGNGYCYLIDLDNNKMYNLENDGYFYHMSASLIHTAVNFGSTPRIQLVVRIPMIRKLDPSYTSVQLCILNPSVDLRYRIDTHISSVLNRLIKSQEIGFFDPVSPTNTNLVLSNDALSVITDNLKKLNIDYKLI